jgi:asparagine synthetase B (glutamine-hydrolysing)
MAGIAGIILKKAGDNVIEYQAVFNLMMNKLSFAKSQLSDSYLVSNAVFGNSIPVSSKNNDHFQRSSELKICTVIDGLVFVDDNERSFISNKYHLENPGSDYELIPFLYDAYGNEIVHHLTGWYNVLIYDEKHNEATLFNDRLGYLPLYYYESATIFAFASKIECLLASGLIPVIEFDKTTFAEHLFFNYVLSDHTYVKNIFTLQNANIIHFNNQNGSKSKYWNTGEFFGVDLVRGDKGFSLVNNGMQIAIDKINSSYGTMNMSLTGGWDSRVVLSYLLPEFKNKLNLFSFGAKNSGDITIPLQIADNECLKYTPYILDEEYLNEFFIPKAQLTIELSNGTRNYKRTHYLYAVQKIASVSGILLSGIFGDEVFKVGYPSGGTVLSQNSIDFINGNFDVDDTIKSFINSPVVKHFKNENARIPNELRIRLEKIKDQVSLFDTLTQKFLSFRFEWNLRKYFGNEVNSYNDFVYNFSPFIDYDFLKNYAKTKYIGSRYPFESKGIKLKRQSTILYHDIVKANYPPLVDYHSSRGYSMKDSVTFSGNLKILARNFNTGTKKTDGFNTGTTDQLFFNTILKNNQHKEYILKQSTLSEPGTSDTNSLFYWLSIVAQRYQS